VDGNSDSEKITKIEEDKIKYPKGLESIHKTFEKKDELVKLSEGEQKSFGAIKVHMGKEKDPKDSLATYQQKLKEIDSLLDDKIITEEVMKD
jgi:hypothetical protein